MTGVYNDVNSILQDAIQSVVSNQGFPTDCDVNIENLDHVLNSAYSVVVKNGGECLALFVKCLEDREDNIFVSESKIFFNNEVVFYGELLEAFENICKRLPEVLYRAVPKCFKTFQSPQISYIILSNLYHEGYHPLDPSTSLPLNHAHLILQELGKLHALSFVLKDQQPLKFASIVDRIQETLFCEAMRPTFGKMFVHAIHDALKLAKCSLPPGSVYADRLSGFTLNVFDKMVALAKDDEEYKVVTHGDLRNGNVMIRHGDGEATLDGIRFLDYQACRYSSPAHDLSFFLFMCVDKPTRDKHLASLTRSYHSTLCASIVQLGSDPLHIFPMSALRAQLKKHARFAVGLALAGLPMYMDEGAEPWDIDKEENPDSEGVLHAAREAGNRKSMRCKNKMMEIVIDAVELGWLD